MEFIHVDEGPGWAFGTLVIKKTYIAGHGMQCAAILVQSKLREVLYETQPLSTYDP